MKNLLNYSGILKYSIPFAVALTVLNCSNVSAKDEEIKNELILIEEELPPLVGMEKGESDDGIPRHIREAAEIVAFEYGISAELLEAIAWRETRFQHDITSANGKYYGLCQIHPSSHSDRMKRLGYTKSDLFNPEVNFRVAADYLTELKEDYGYSTIVSLIHYHGEGKEAIKAFTQHGKMSGYVRDVIEMSKKYKEAHNVEV